MKHLYIGILFIAFSHTVGAAVRYSYTGNPFVVSEISNDSIPSGSYTSEMRITIELTLSAPLGPNFGNIFLTSDSDFRDRVLDYQFSDGRNTLVPSNSFNPFQTFLAITDATGAIIAWDLGADIGISSNFGVFRQAGGVRKGISSFNGFSSLHSNFPISHGAQDAAVIDECTVSSSNDCTSYGSDSVFVFDAPGAWTITTLTSVPLPSSGLLLSLTLLCVTSRVGKSKLTESTGKF